MKREIKPNLQNYFLVILSLIFLAALNTKTNEIKLSENEIDSPRFVEVGNKVKTETNRLGVNSYYYCYYIRVFGYDRNNPEHYEDVRAQFKRYCQINFGKWGKINFMDRSFDIDKCNCGEKSEFNYLWENGLIAFAEYRFNANSGESFGRLQDNGMIKIRYDSDSDEVYCD